MGIQEKLSPVGEYVFNMCKAQDSVPTNIQINNIGAV